MSYCLVYTPTHPDDVTECRNVYDAHAVATRLVSEGFDIRCERYTSDHSQPTILGWSDLCEIVNGGV